MSGESTPARRRPLPLLLAVAGLALWWLSPGTWAAALPLLFCPGWGLSRLLSVADRNFGVAGSALCLSLLIAGLVPLIPGLHPASWGAVLHAASLLLTVLGTWRLAAYDRWRAGQPAHPDPMPLWPARTATCLVVIAVAVTAVLLAEPLLRPAETSARPELAARALAWTTQGEDPFRAGHPPRVGLLPATAIAALSAGSGVHALVLAGLVALSCLVATLLFVGEGISRLWGNRGATRAMLALLLGLNPLATFFLLGASEQDDPVGALTPAFDPGLTTALLPFLQGSADALVLAFTAMLLSCTLSTLRRASTHVPRLLAAAAAGLALTRPEAALLLAPGWILGIAMAHVACRGNPDNDRHSTTRRAGEPAVLRAPFWRPVLHLAAGLGLALWFVEAPAPVLASHPRVVAWGLLAAVGPTCLLFMPGIRHLNASPGREAFFFVGLVTVMVVLGVTLDTFGDRGAMVVRLLSLVLAVPCANGALKMIEIHGDRARVLLAVIVLGILPAPWLVLTVTASSPRALVLDDPARDAVLHAPALEPALVRALLETREDSPHGAVLILAPASSRADGALAVLLAERSLLDTDADDPEAERRRGLVDRIARGDGTALLGLRALPGLAGREFWAPGSQGWPGFVPRPSPSGDVVLQHARPPAVVLVTVAGLRADRLNPDDMPALSALAARGVRFDQAVVPLPDTVPGVLTLFTGHPRGEATEASVEERYRARGYRTVAVVGLAPDQAEFPLAHHFETAHELPSAAAGTLVDLALLELGAADPRPAFVWLHLDDLLPPLRAPPSELPGRAPPASPEVLFPADGDVPALIFAAPTPHAWTGDDVELRLAAGLEVDPSETAGGLPGRGAGVVMVPSDVDWELGLRLHHEQVARLDRELHRLAQSLRSEDLLAVTAPHGSSLLEHQAWFDHGHDLFEPSIQIPFVVLGGGLPRVVHRGLASLADLPALLLEGRWPERDGVALVSRVRPGLGSGAIFPADVDPTSRGGPRRIFGLRTSGRKLILVRAPGSGLPAAGLAYDLVADPGEHHPRPATQAELERLLEVRAAFGDDELQPPRPTGG